MSGEEFELIDDLAAALGGDGSAGERIGDDGVLVPRGSDVVVTDTTEEGVHFMRHWSSLGDIAYRALATNVSDVLAMGARPRAWLLNLSLPPQWSAHDTQQLIGGFNACCSEWDVGALIGGDTLTRAAGLSLTVTLFGTLEGRRPWLRTGFRAGQKLWTDGPLGLAAAGLDLYENETDFAEDARRSSAAASCRARHRRPVPPPSRDAAGVRGAIDISDGLSSDLWHCARASGTRLVIDRELPGRELLLELSGGDVSLVERWQWDGGDDYVRVVAATEQPAAHWIEIGRIEEGAASVVEARGGSERVIAAGGWVHCGGEG